MYKVSELADSFRNLHPSDFEKKITSIGVMPNHRENLVALAKLDRAKLMEFWMPTL